jgi:putative transcriptional regulator
MEQKEINQRELAVATGLSPTTVSKLARNHFDRIDNNTVITLCRYFGLSQIDQLIELVPSEGDL